MAKTGTAAPAISGEDLVEYTAPRLGPRDQSVFVGVNGETIRIQRGKPVWIKRKFVEVLEHAQEQEELLLKSIENAQRSSSRALARL